MRGYIPNVKYGAFFLFILELPTLLREMDSGSNTFRIHSILDANQSYTFEIVFQK